ncbi:hypothetical protein BASA81_009082 [Batrachochytrium salamandrivorans]|nr:hypothetical protein BASA81_009082 [Batrachochytrium salamandrivorans]
MLWLLLGVVALAGSESHSLGNGVWDLLPEFSQAKSATPSQTTVLVLHFDSLVSKLNGTAQSRGGIKSPIELAFLLPSSQRQVVCKVDESPLLEGGLRHQLPNLVVKHGSCNDGRTVFLNLLLDSNSSFSATFSVPNSTDWLYVDHVAGSAGSTYVLYPKSSQTAAESFTCKSTHLEVLSGRGKRQLSAATSTATWSGVFRLAVAANREFSIFAGDTPAAVTNAIAIVISRVNGIYERELGVYFQLIEDNPKLLCTKDKTSGCSTLLPDDDGTAILYGAMGFMLSRGVSASKFDIGHVFTTGSGGVAGVGVLCDSAWKAAGNTGMLTPLGDAFSVDYVAHELGHQMGAFHTFRDCGGADSEYEELNGETYGSAVEPGSGSTIMAYAGICGKHDLQSHSDAYFHPTSLISMRDFIQSKLQSKCGKATLLSASSPQRPRPQIISDFAECQIPVGNAFRLRGVANSAATWFQWDQADPGFQAYDDLAVPRFRSWKPRSEPERYFPNLYYQTLGLHLIDPYMYYERLPSKPTQLSFWFLARTQFAADSNTSMYNENMMGDFAYQGLQVRFVSTTPALLFTEETRMALKQPLRSGVRFPFAWNAGGAGASQVEVLMARNTMTQVVSPTKFDSDRDIHVLDWIVLGVVPNNGSADLPLALLSADNTTVNFMLRVAANAKSEHCVAFDYVGLSMLLPAVDQVYTKAPSRAPTLEPGLVPPLDGTTVFQTLEQAVVFDPNAVASPTCLKTKITAGFHFTAPSDGTFMFSTKSVMATCHNTALAIGSTCVSDDGDNAEDVGSDDSSHTYKDLKKREQVDLLVGGEENECKPGDTVAMTATQVYRVQSAETVTGPVALACQANGANCPVARCFGAEKYVPYLFTPKVNNALYEFVANSACGNATLSIDAEVCQDEPTTLVLAKNARTRVYVGSKHDECPDGLSLSVSPPYYEIKANAAVKIVPLTNTCTVGSFGCSPGKCLSTNKFVAYWFKAEEAGTFAFSLGTTKKACPSAVIVIDGNCNKAGNGKTFTLKNVAKDQVVKVFVGSKNNACQATRTIGLRVKYKGK